MRSVVRKPRSDSYLGGLSEEERGQVEAALFTPGLSLSEAALRMPLMRRGAGPGKPPSPELLSRLRRELTTDKMLFGVEESTRPLERAAARYRAGRELSQEQEKMLDEIMGMVGEEVIEKTLARLDPASRTAAARLLLKRADQRRVDRRQDFIEAQAKKKSEPPPPPPRLTEEDKQRRLKELMEIA